MAQQRSQRSDPGQPAVYEIRVEGHLGHGLAGWFAGLSITPDDDGDTLITGTVVDQAALHGLLKKVRDLGVPLVSVTRVEPGREPEPGEAGPSQAGPREEGDGDAHRQQDAAEGQ